MATSSGVAERKGTMEYWLRIVGSKNLIYV
jgi:hypothetical protein